jgi:hypothetical protein
MNKRELLCGATSGALAALAAGPASAQTRASKPAPLSGPALLTVSGLIGAGNRGPLDPALDQMMVKQKVSFDMAHVFDFSALVALPARTIHPTLEYDARRHALSGPLLVDVVKAAGAQPGQATALLLRAVDGYAVQLPVAEAVARRFILATHLDGRPMPLGGLGPLWAVYEPDGFADMAAKPLPQRFSLCPWATYHIEVRST